MLLDYVIKKCWEPTCALWKKGSVCCGVRARGDLRIWSGACARGSVRARGGPRIWSGARACDDTCGLGAGADNIYEI